MNIIKPLKVLYDTAEYYMDNEFTFINYDIISEIAELFEEQYKSHTPPNITHKNVRAVVVKSLFRNAVNYCYWYGTDRYRPDGSNSTKLYRLLNEEIVIDNVTDFTNEYQWEHIGNAFKSILVENRFPLLEDRQRHIQEIMDNGLLFFKKLFQYKEFKSVADDRKILSHAKPQNIIDLLIHLFPGYSSDIFLKRAILFVYDLQRELEIFDDKKLDFLPVPTDYQIPRVLNYLNIIQYSDTLNEKIINGTLISKHSAEEISIRANTINACHALRRSSNLTGNIIDDYLWQLKKQCDTPFHLTITTDY